MFDGRDTHGLSDISNSAVGYDCRMLVYTLESYLVHLVSKSTLDGVAEPASRAAAPISAPAAAAAAGRCWPVTKVTDGGLNDVARSGVYEDADQHTKHNVVIIISLLAADKLVSSEVSVLLHRQLPWNNFDPYAYWATLGVVSAPGKLINCLPEGRENFFRFMPNFCRALAASLCMPNAILWWQVCPSVRPPVTLQYCIETNAYIVKFFSPSGRGMTLALSPLQNSKANSLSGVYVHYTGGKICVFRQNSPFISENIRDRPMVATNHY